MAAHPVRRLGLELDELLKASVLILGTIERGHVDALDPAQLNKGLVLCQTALPAGGIDVHKVVDELLTVAEEEYVDDIRHRLRVADAGAACADERLILAALT